MSLPSLISAALMAVVLLFSIIVHEVAHGYVALLQGDPTAKFSGRLTLNPLPHIDPIGTVFLPLLLIIMHSPFLFGWARPVPVNPLNFRDQRWGEITVSAAGPLSNLALAVVFAFLLRSGLGGAGLITMASYGVVINILLALFNLIPVPPLDGSHLLAALLPPSLARYYQVLEPFGMLLILVLYFFGFISILYRITLQIAHFLVGF